MRVALISIGNCPSLALRNIRRYCRAHEDLRDRVEFAIYDYDIRSFRDARTQSSRQWSYVTQIDSALEEIVAFGPDVIAFSCYLWNTELSLHLAHLLELALPRVLVVFGGPDAGPRAAELLERHSQVDVVIEGDGEIPFLELLRQQLGDSPDFAAVPGARFLRDRAMTTSTATAEPVNMSLLREVYDSIPTSQEMSQWYWPNLIYETLRGCPYQCSYCMYGKTPMNEKDADLAIEELAELLERGLIVEIVDPTFTTFKARAKEILRGLGEREYSGRLQFEAYADSIDEEMAELMVAARVSAVGIGFQTLSSEGLKAVKRPKNLARFERGIGFLDAHDIYYYVDIIYGLPRTTVDDFLATVDYLFSLGISRLLIYRLLGLPGSPMMDDADEYRMVFSKIPPYELLSSSTFTLQDILFCDRFQEAYTRLLGTLPADELEGYAAAFSGRVSGVVQRFMDAELDPDELRRRLAASPGSPTARNTPPESLAANSPASHSRADSAAPAAPFPG